jgi:hypothetical protein
MRLSDLNILDFGNSIQMTGAVFSSDDTSYLCMFPGEELRNSDTLVMDTEDWKNLIHQTDMMETEILAKAADGALVKIIYRKSQRNIDQVVSWKVFRRDNYTCRYCGADSVPLTVDHLVCWESGGPSIESNLLTSCKKCNKIRGNKSYAEWLRHPRYLETKKKLSQQVQQANEAILATLDAIPRQHVRSR